MVTATADPRVPTSQARLIDEMDALSVQPVWRIQSWLQATAERRRLATDECAAAGDAAGLCSLHLRQSVLHLLSRNTRRALQMARSAMDVAGASAPPSLKALLLTQVAACSRAAGDMRGAIQSVRRAEALLSCELGDATPQMLAVRHQLVALLRHGRIADQLAEERLKRSFQGLLALASDPVSRAGLSRLVQILDDGSPPPHWALCFCRRWAVR